MPPKMRLRARFRFGRVVFSRYALPTIRPVSHILDDDDTIVIHAGPGITLTPDRQVVAYQADTIDHHTLRGWCVIITGTAEQITDPDDIAHYRRLLRAAFPGPRDRFIRIHPEIITGVEYLTTAVATPLRRHGPAATSTTE
ncbi:pyridoxamine 5'-phosphate oxidase family protein [Nocardia transvalensis]|uniref:pyridoxamine 5'-phosphate oxidase family protein n=1 Tax=Nocardia transvalensis TaxID=37333 RepID=UPI0018944B12|nr:pyridoxamine 5'-phosphate oxidase family protein [Nocardia transvalensis]MBF6328460.1 pyridoxamine 5'-phosphate oxidase family protein [Nocardia transvalensis]